jgi:hypothetical protein
MPTPTNKAKIKYVPFASYKCLLLQRQEVIVVYLQSLFISTPNFQAKVDSALVMFKNCLQPPIAFTLLCTVDSAVPHLLPLTIPIHQLGSFMVEQFTRKSTK